MENQVEIETENAAFEGVKALTMKDWDAVLAAKQRLGVPFRVDEEVFEYFLGVLPPVSSPTVPGSIFSFGFAEGIERVTVFWRTKEGRYFGKLTRRINTPWS